MRGPITVQIEAVGGLGVAGTATLTEAGIGRTRVEVSVSPSGNLNMPAHLHEGAAPRSIRRPDSR